MEIYHVYTMDADSTAQRTIVITIDEEHAREVLRKTYGGCINIWKDNQCINRKVV